jgi:hypothetical protein
MGEELNSAAVAAAEEAAAAVRSTGACGIVFPGGELPPFYHVQAMQWL